MGQVIFFALFMIALLAGVFAYIAPSQKPISPLGFMMDKSGFNSVEALNRKRSLQLNMRTDRGLMQIRKKMDDLAVQQNKFLDTIQEQQQIIKNTGNDLLRLNALTADMQDQQRLLVAHGQYLVTLSNQLTEHRQWIADEIDLGKINSETSLRILQRRYAQLRAQAAVFLDKVTQHNQDVRDRMAKVQDQLHDLANNAAYDSTVQQQSTRERIERMLEKEHENMIKLADTQEHSRELLKDVQESFAQSQELFNDKLQQTQDLIDEDRQKQIDQQWITQQRIADEEQHAQDQRDSQVQRNR